MPHNLEDELLAMAAAEKARRLAGQNAERNELPSLEALFSPPSLKTATGEQLASLATLFGGASPPAPTDEGDLIRNLLAGDPEMARRILADLTQQQETSGDLDLQSFELGCDDYGGGDVDLDDDMLYAPQEDTAFEVPEADLSSLFMTREARAQIQLTGSFPQDYEPDDLSSIEMGSMGDLEHNHTSRYASSPGGRVVSQRGSDGRFRHVAQAPRVDVTRASLDVVRGGSARVVSQRGSDGRFHPTNAAPRTASARTVEGSYTPTPFNVPRTLEDQSSRPTVWDKIQGDFLDD